MWFNSMQREEPYPGLNRQEKLAKASVVSAILLEVLHGCRQLVS
jgi:hypothetical protein